MLNDLKQFISQKDNAILENIFSFYATEGVDEFMKEKIEEWDFAMTVLLIIFGPNFINALCYMIHLMLLDSSGKDTRQISREKYQFYLSQHTEFLSSVWKWLNHEWTEKYDVDIDPFDDNTFPFKVPMDEFPQTSNDSLISINY